MKTLRWGIIGSLAFTLLTIPFSWSQEGGEASPKTPQERQIFNPLAKSLLIPGWGQFSEKHYLEGVLLISSEIYCLARALHFDARGNDAYNQYKAATSSADAISFRQLTEKNDGLRNRFLLAAAAVWAVNLLDIYLIAGGKKPSSKTSWTFKIAHAESQTIAVLASCRF